MASSIQFSGMASGLNTAEMVNALMDVQAIPKTLLEAKIADKNVIIGGLQGLNSLIQKLGTEAEKFTGFESTGLAAYSTSSSSDIVKVTANSGAQPSNLDVVVDQTAAAHTVVSEAMSAWQDDPPALTVIGSDGQSHEITAEGTSISSIAAAINNSDAGVHATTVRAGTNGAGEALYRLQVSADESGAAGAFQVFAGSAADVTAGTATDLATAGAVTQQGQDASIRLYAGTTAEQTITSASNTFTELLPGVDITVNGVSTEPVSIAVSADTETSTAMAKTFIDKIADAISRIATGSKATVDETDGTTLGVFTGDSTVRRLKQSLTDAVIVPVDGQSPSQIGISIDRYGAITFDEEKFAEAMAADPAAAESFFTSITARVGDISEMYSDKYDGILTNRITSQETATRGLEDQVERMEIRLEKRRATLESQFLHMEQMISQFNAQSSYLTSQIASLPQMGGGSSDD